MLCLQHLLRNIFHKFPDLKEHGPKNIVIHSVNQAASSGAMNNFFEIINRMVYSLFELSIPLSRVVEMIAYILRIDPSHWTVFANTPSYDKDNYDTQKKNLLTRIYSAYFLEERIDPQEHNSVDTIIDLLKQCDEWGVTHAETAKTKPIYHNHK